MPHSRSFVRGFSPLHSLPRPLNVLRLRCILRYSLNIYCNDHTAHHIGFGGLLDDGRAMAGLAASGISDVPAKSA